MTNIYKKLYSEGKPATSGPELFFASDEGFGIAVGDIHQVVPVAFDIFRWATLQGNVKGNILRGHHVNRIPGANLGAVLAADAAVKINVAP